MSSSGSRTELISDLGLRAVTEIPETYQHIFSGYPCFNAIQSKLLDFMLQTDESLVVSAPTGSGKTVLFELAIIRLLLQAEEGVNHEREDKIVYMAPVKALVNEKYNDWVNKFSSIGVRCLEVTGDSDFMSLVTIKDYQLILTTPEKWDSMTRRWNHTHHLEIIQQVKLFLIDEVHLLNEERRGSTLEAVVSRMKTVQKTIDRSGSGLRFIAVSATIPNGEDLAVWLGTNNKPARFAKIGEDMRPVKLKKIVLGFRHDEHKTPFAFDVNLSYHLKNVVLKYSNGKPTLVFCNSRKSVQTTSSILVKQVKFQQEGVGQQILVDAANQVSDATLADYLKAGIGNHHAGMTIADRSLIEQLFRDGKLPVLISTSTLAMGVNLPAHLVVVKSTDCYMQSEMKPYTDAQLLQMIGRAGRPQFDTSAVAVIMTKMTDKDRFERLVSGSEPIESTLHKNLAELLNAEVVLQTVTDVARAVDWISSTYFYVRASRCPQRYGLPNNLPLDAFHARLHDMCMIELNGLVRYKIIDMSEGYDVSPTDEGSLMAKYYIRFDTMKQFMQMKSNESIEGLLQLLSKSAEFADVRLRVVEKRLLNTLNGTNKDAERIRFPMKEKIKSKEMKINCLIQATLDGRQVYDNALSQEAKQIMRIASRLSNGLVYLVWSKGYFRSLLSALYLSKSLHCSMWENSTFVSRQLPGIGPALSTLLVMAGKTSFRSLLEANPRDLETILNRNPPFGNSLQRDIMCLPMYDLQIRELEGESSVQVTLLITNKETVEEFGDLEHKSALVIGVGGSANILLHKENIRDRALILRGGEYCVKVSLESASYVNEIEAHLISSTIVGLDVVSKLKMSDSPPSPSPQIQQQQQQRIQTCIDKYMKKKKNIVREISPKLRKVDKNEAKRLTNLSFNMEKFACKAKSKKSITELSTASQIEENAQEMKTSPFSDNSSHEETEHSLNRSAERDEQTKSENSKQRLASLSHRQLDSISDIDSGCYSVEVPENSSNNRFVGKICADFKENYNPDSEYPSLNKDGNDNHQLEQEMDVVEQICSKYKGSNSIFKWTKRIPRFSQPKVRAESGTGRGETSYEEKLVKGICDEVSSRLFPQRNRTPQGNMQSTRKSQSSSMKITDYVDKRYGSFTPARSLSRGTPKSAISESFYSEEGRHSSRMLSRGNTHHSSYSNTLQSSRAPNDDVSSIGSFGTPRVQENDMVSANFKSYRLSEDFLINNSRTTRTGTDEMLCDGSSSSNFKTPRPRGPAGEILVENVSVDTFKSPRTQIDRKSLGASSECNFRTQRASSGEMLVENSSSSTFGTTRAQLNGVLTEDSSESRFMTHNDSAVDVLGYKNNMSVLGSSLMPIKIERDCENTDSHATSEETFEVESPLKSTQNITSPFHPALRSDFEVSTRPVDNQATHCLIDNFELRNTKFYPLFPRSLHSMLEISKKLLPETECTSTDERISQLHNQICERDIEEENTAHFSQYSSSKTFEGSASVSQRMSTSIDGTNEIPSFNLNQNQSILNPNNDQALKNVYDSSYQGQIVQSPQSNSASFSQNCSQATLNGIPSYLENKVSKMSYSKVSQSPKTETREASSSVANYFQQNRGVDVLCSHPSQEQSLTSSNAKFSQQQFPGNSEVDQNKTTEISKFSEDSEVNPHFHYQKNTVNLNSNNITKNQRYEMPDTNGQNSFRNQCFESKKLYDLLPTHATGMRMDDVSFKILQEKSRRPFDFHDQYQAENEFNQEENDPKSSWRNFSQESCLLIDNIIDDCDNECMRPEVNSYISKPKNSYEDARKIVNGAGNKCSVAITKNDRTDSKYRYKSEHELKENSMRLNNSPTNSQIESDDDDALYVTIDDLLTQKHCAQKSPVEPIEARILQQTGNAHTENDKFSGQAHPDPMKLTIPNSKYQLGNMESIEKCQRYLKSQHETIDTYDKKNEADSIDTVKYQGGADDILIWDTTKSRYITYEEQQTSQVVRNDRNVKEDSQSIARNRSTFSEMNFPTRGNMNEKRGLIDQSTSESQHRTINTNASKISELHVETYDSMEMMSSEEFSPPTMYVNDHSFVGGELQGNELSFCSEIKEEPDYKLETSALKVLEKCDTKSVDRFGCCENCSLHSKALGETCNLGGQELKSGCQMLSPLNDYHGLVKKSSCIHCSCSSSDVSGPRYSMPICAGRRDPSYACHPGHQLKDKTGCPCFATGRHHIPNHLHSFPDLGCSHSSSFPSCAAPCHVANSNTCTNRCMTSCTDVTRKQPTLAACSCSYNKRSYLEGHQCCVSSQISRYRCEDGSQTDGFSHTGGRDFISAGELEARPSDVHPTSSNLFTTRTSAAPSTATACGCCNCEILS